jgi:hypothetical protein
MGVRAAAHSVPPKFVPAMQDHPDDNFSSGTAAPEVLRHVRLDQTKITYEVGVFIHLLQPKLDANSQLIMNI